MEGPRVSDRFADLKVDGPLAQMNFSALLDKISESYLNWLGGDETSLPEVVDGCNVGVTLLGGQRTVNVDQMLPRFQELARNPFIIVHKRNRCGFRPQEVLVNQRGIGFIEIYLCHPEYNPAQSSEIDDLVAAALVLRISRARPVLLRTADLSYDAALQRIYDAPPANVRMEVWSMRDHPLGMNLRYDFDSNEIRGLVREIWDLWREQKQSIFRVDVYHPISLDPFPNLWSALSSTTSLYRTHPIPENLWQLVETYISYATNRPGMAPGLVAPYFPRLLELFEDEATPPFIRVVAQDLLRTERDETTAVGNLRIHRMTGDLAALQAIAMREPHQFRREARGSRAHRKPRVGELVHAQAAMEQERPGQASSSTALPTRAPRIPREVGFREPVPMPPPSLPEAREERRGKPTGPVKVIPPPPQPPLPRPRLSRGHPREVEAPQTPTRAPREAQDLPASPESPENQAPIPRARLPPPTELPVLPPLAPEGSLTTAFGLPSLFSIATIASQCRDYKARNDQQALHALMAPHEKTIGAIAQTTHTSRTATTLLLAFLEQRYDDVCYMIESPDVRAELLSAGFRP